MAKCDNLRMKTNVVTLKLSELLYAPKIIHSKENPAVNLLKPKI